MKHHFNGAQQINKTKRKYLYVEKSVQFELYCYASESRELINADVFLPIKLKQPKTAAYTSNKLSNVLSATDVC